MLIPAAPAARYCLRGASRYRFGALAAWAVTERGITTVGELLMLVPGAVCLPTEIASEWEQAQELDLRRLAGGPSTPPHLPGLLRDLLAELEERRREILIRRTFARHPQSMDALAGEFGVSRGRIGQLENSALVRLGVAVTGDKYAPLRWHAHTLASTGAEPDPGLLQATGPWAGPLLRWLAFQTQNASTAKA